MAGSPRTPASSSDGRIAYAQLDLDNMQQMMQNLRAGGAPDMTPAFSASLTPEAAGPSRAPAGVRPAIVEDATVPTGYAMLDLDKTMALAQTRHASKESTVSLKGGKLGLGVRTCAATIFSFL
jgi:hypothetical protein